MIDARPSARNMANVEQTERIETQCGSMDGALVIHAAIARTAAPLQIRISAFCAARRQSNLPKAPATRSPHLGFHGLHDPGSRKWRGDVDHRRVHAYVVFGLVARGEGTGTAPTTPGTAGRCDQLHVLRWTWMERHGLTCRGRFKHPTSLTIPQKLWQMPAGYSAFCSREDGRHRVVRSDRSLQSN